MFHFVSRVKAKARERNYDPVSKTKHLALIWVILDSAEWVIWIVRCVAQGVESSWDLNLCHLRQNTLAVISLNIAFSPP